MKFKKFEIKKGKHSARGLNFGFTFSKKIKFKARFTSSCLYSIDGNDQYDINKLYGFSTTWFHHKQSARIGWRCLNNKIEVLTYTYCDGKRDLEESKKLGEVNPNQEFICTITDLEDSYLYTFQLVNDNRIVKIKNRKKRDWFLFNYKLYFFFGGNKPAPHDMIVYIKKI